MFTRRSIRWVGCLCLVATLFVGGSSHGADHSEAQKAWEIAVGKRFAEIPAFAYVHDDPSLPRVLIIGDSISIGYTAQVRTLLKGKANIHRIPTNGGNTEKGLEQLDTWLGDGKWDLIHFNWGLHDLKRVNAGSLDASAPVTVTLDAYAANLRKLVTRLQKTGAKLLWANTTPVPAGAQGRIAGEERQYNHVADGVMKEMGVATNDLHAFVLPHLEIYQGKADVHFNETGRDFMAAQVAKVIGDAL